MKEVNACRHVYIFTIKLFNIVSIQFKVLVDFDSVQPPPQCFSKRATSVLTYCGKTSNPEILNIRKQNYRTNFNVLGSCKFDTKEQRIATFQIIIS